MSALGVGFVGQLHFFAFVLAGLLGIGVTIWGLANLEKQATVEFAVFAGASSIWVFLVATQVVAGIEHQYPLYLLAAIMEVVTIGAWFWFTLTYTGYREELSTGAWVAYGLFVAIAFGAVVTDPWLGLAFGERATVMEPFAIADWEPGMLGGLLAAYTYGSFGLGTLALAYRFHTTGYAKTWQAPFLLYLNAQLFFIDSIGELLTVAVNPVSYSALAAPLTGALYYAVLYRHDVLGFAPVARQAIFAEMTDAAVVLNPDGRVVDFNDAAEAFVTDPEEAVGEHAEDVLPAVVVDHALHGDPDGSDGDAVEFDMDGETRYYDVSLASVSTSKGEAGRIITLRDVTRPIEQQHRLEEQTEELERQRDELERQNERLDRFASTVAHDLRNPLTVAQTYTNQMDREVDHEYVDTVSDSLERMDRMVDDILTLAREGASVEEVEEVSLDESARLAFEYADTADATLHVEGDRDFRADASRLEHVFGNLFRNAVDHGPDDADIYVEATDDGFAIEDTGPGIPEEKRDEVFDHGYTTSSDGTGFGLSIVEEIADAHGWSVNVTAGDRAGGARFEFSLNSSSGGD